MTEFAEFRDWRDAFADRAQGAGLAGLSLEHLGSAQLLPDVIAKDRHQPEAVLPIWSYLDRVVTPERITAGQAALHAHRAGLAAIQEAFSVPPTVLVAIWGIETGFGAIRGDTPVIDALATLAFDGRRRALFEGELLAALEILGTGEAPAEGLFGSWAGAMGHTQFMPSSWLRRAVDFDGDGRRDVWGDDPTDALASAANFLVEAGWHAQQSWGAEVDLPSDLPMECLIDNAPRSREDWVDLGFLLPEALDGQGSLALRLPAGHAGPAFLTGQSFGALLSYNPSLPYALAVAHLSDQIAGGAPFVRGWPRNTPELTRADLQSLQQRLTALGFDTKGADGLPGPNTKRAVAGFQQSEGLVPDGFLSTQTLARLG